MSEQTSTSGRTGRREGLRVRFQNLNFAREQRIFGTAEIVGLGGSILILVLVVFSYLYFLIPARTQLDAFQSERTLLQAQLTASREVVVQGENTESAVQKITHSLDDFESNQLLVADRGRMGIYDTLNSLIRKNGLRNTSGPTYSPLEPSDSKAGANGNRSANTKWQSIYPGIAISVTVEGQYTNLRHFIRDLETDKQFIIINSVELERSTETNNLPTNESAGVPNALVSLRLEMSTYFRRASRDEGANDSPSR